eukprot:863786-Amphidinium_carterae.1
MVLFGEKLGRQRIHPHSKSAMHKRGARQLRRKDGSFILSCEVYLSSLHKAHFEGVKSRYPCTFQATDAKPLADTRFHRKVKHAYTQPRSEALSKSMP